MSIESLSIKDTYLMLVKTKAADNNNKFYELTLMPDGTVKARYGRVDGKSEQIANKGSGIHTLLSVARSKMRDGYRRVEVLSNGNSTANQEFAMVVKRDIAQNDPVLITLVEQLISINRHQLMEASGGKITIKDGQVCTAVGLITLNNVVSAKKILAEIQSGFLNKKTSTESYLKKLDEYLTLVPQKVPHQRGWGPTFFEDFTTFERQFDLLEQLESSIEAMLLQAKDELKVTIDEKPKVFAYSIKPVSDKKIIKSIEKYFSETSNRMHISSKLKLKSVYEVCNPDAENQYKIKSKKVGNVKHLWHGTRACNLLSILKGGLIIPKSRDRNFTITGRMFGDGLYFSDQSTKALNYSYGYWGNGGYDNNCFMFLCDVAMGREYTPHYSGDAKRAGYDSCFAKANVSGVKNNEMIVYNVDQAFLRYLCEFEEK